VALPKNIMQVDEMVNLTLGGRRLGPVPHAVWVGAAYYTDRPTAGDDKVLRTSGLLSGRTR
jgi:hypothetical protein